MHFIQYDGPWCPGHHPRQNILSLKQQDITSLACSQNVTLEASVRLA